MEVKVKSGSVLFDSLRPMDCSPPGSSVHGILQARILEGVAIPFSRGSSLLGDRTLVSCIAGGFFTAWATEARVINLDLTLHVYKHISYVNTKSSPNLESRTLEFQAERAATFYIFPPCFPFTPRRWPTLPAHPSSAPTITAKAGAFCSTLTIHGSRGGQRLRRMGLGKGSANPGHSADVVEPHVTIRINLENMMLNEQE